MPVEVNTEPLPLGDGAVRVVKDAFDPGHQCTIFVHTTPVVR